jgi:carboxyl-terminal processing protease
MKRQNGGCSASALFKAAVFSLLAFSQFAPTAWAQNRLRYPTAQAPIQGAVDTAYGDTTDAANAPQFSAPALGPATPELSRPSLNAPSPNTPAMSAPSLNEPAPAAKASTPSNASAMVASALDQGKNLETQHRWAEAYALYEDMSRQTYGQPEPELTQRLDVAKMHFDIGRRYADSNYRRNVATQTDAEALEMFTDAANKLQAHYVQNPDWAALVERGTHDLQIAMLEPSFQENNGQQISTERLNGFFQELQRQQVQHPVHTLSDARTAVWTAGQIAQMQLQVRPSATTSEFTAAMLGGLDEYSAFLTSGQLNDLYSQIEGNFVGLGVELKAADGILLIVNVIHNSPAERAGIKAGDRIVSVAGRTTTDLNTDKAAELLQGPEGSTVDLAVVTGNEAPRPLTIRRAHVDVPSVDDVKIVDQDSGIGYFKLTCFQKTTSHDVDTALWQLQRSGMRSLIIDLRGNPGGLLTAAVEVANKFINQGSIVSTRGRSPGEDYNYTAQGNASWRVPLVVLIDGDSASAAEILSGALRDYHRATIVGTRSYGKGSVQGIFPLAIGGGGVRLTTAKFYSPLGKPFSHIGVEPDPGFEVHVAAKPIDGHVTIPASTGTQDDPFVSAGLRAARSQLAQR